MEVRLTEAQRRLEGRRREGEEEDAAAAVGAAVTSAMIEPTAVAVVAVQDKRGEVVGMVGADMVSLLEGAVATDQAGAVVAESRISEERAGEQGGRREEGEGGAGDFKFRVPVAVLAEPMVSASLDASPPQPSVDLASGGGSGRGDDVIAGECCGLVVAATEAITPSRPPYDGRLPASELPRRSSLVSTVPVRRARTCGSVSAASVDISPEERQQCRLVIAMCTGSPCRENK